MRKLFLTIFLVILFPVLAWGATRYVDSSDGSNSYDGTTPDPIDGHGPWATLTYAESRISGGDTVIVYAGSGPYNETVSINVGGNGEGNETTFQAAAGETVQVSGFRIRADYIKIDGFKIVQKDTGQPCKDGGTGYRSGIRNEGYDYCIFTNNTITDCYGVGITLQPGSDYNTLSNNTIYEVASAGIYIFGTHHTITNNEIYSVFQTRGGCDPTGGDDADGIRFFGSHHTFTSNYIHGIDYTGNDSGAHIDAFQTWGTPCASNITWDSNHVHMYDYHAYDPLHAKCSFIMATYSDVVNWTLKNNIIRTTATINFAYSRVDNVDLYNNTFVARIGDWEKSYPHGISFMNGTNCQVYNNIFVDWKDYHITSLGTGSDSDYNLKWNSDGSTPGGQGQQPHDVWKEDPNFVNFSTTTTDPTDYKLQDRSSPAYDAGKDMPGIVADDCASTTRPRDSAWDIGAYEYTDQWADGSPPMPPSGLRILQ